MKLRIVFSLLFITVLCSGCVSTNNPSDQENLATAEQDSLADTSEPESPLQGPALAARAEEALKEFHQLLNEGRYDQAVKLYGGSFEVLRGWNPESDPADLTGLLQAGCERNGLMCLEVLNILSIQTNDEHEFLFEIEFANPDGSTFVRGPCCGATEEDSLSESSFMAQVVCRDDGSCVVMDLPPYVP